MTTSPSPDDSRTFTQSVKLSREAHSDAFDASISAATLQRKSVGISTILRLWIDAARNIYRAKSRDEAITVAVALFESNPKNKRS